MLAGVFSHASRMGYRGSFSAVFGPDLPSYHPHAPPRKFSRSISAFSRPRATPPASPPQDTKNRNQLGSLGFSSDSAGLAFFFFELYLAEYATIPTGLGRLQTETETENFCGA